MLPSEAKDRNISKDTSFCCWRMRYPAMSIYAKAGLLGYGLQPRFERHKTSDSMSSGRNKGSRAANPGLHFSAMRLNLWWDFLFKWFLSADAAGCLVPDPLPLRFVWEAHGSGCETSSKLDID
jgi:hypothetical protein